MVQCEYFSTEVGISVACHNMPQHVGLLKLSTWDRRLLIHEYSAHVVGKPKATIFPPSATRDCLSTSGPSGGEL